MIMVRGQHTPTISRAEIATGGGGKEGGKEGGEMEGWREERREVGGREGEW